VFAALARRGAPRARLGATVDRGWGTYTVLQEGPGYKIKRLEVRPGKRLSLQLHHHRSEHWVVVAGQAHVECDDRSFVLGVHESTFIPAGARHRLANRTADPIVLIEVQCGSYVGEDDIVRLD
jgi:mannose-1-phosphate guanylyltransferase